MPPVLLVVAGLDPSGGAGLLADCATASRRGLHVAGVATALTVQSSVGCDGFQAVDVALLKRQLVKVLSDLPIAAVKIGMLGSPAIVSVVAECLATLGPRVPVVLDPVWQATVGAGLFDGSPVTALAPLWRLVTLLTPNSAEASLLTGICVKDAAGQVAAARILREQGARAVLIKGGHLEGERVADLLDDGGEPCWFDAPRIEGPSPHGTGCALSTEIACLLAEGLDLRGAVAIGRERLLARIAHASRLGQGQPFLDI